MNSSTDQTHHPPRTAARNPAAPSARRDGVAALTLAAIGVVYGDIGTSPLYTVKEIFAPRHRRGASHPTT